MLKGVISKQMPPLAVCSATSVAAACGHLEALVWARSQGCPWDTFSALLVAESGLLEVLQWVRADGCL